MNVAIIPARSGSKRIYKKNIKPFAGKPIIAYSILAANETGLFDRIIVSTDSDEIGEIAKFYGAEVPFIRPSELATDDAPKLPVLQHAVKYSIENLGYNPDFVLDLDPTSPLREIRDIQNGYDKLVNDPSCDCVISAFKAIKNPYFNMVEVKNNGKIELSKDFNSHIIRRQDAPEVYSINASVYVWRTKDLLNSVDKVHELFLDTKEREGAYQSVFGMDFDKMVDEFVYKAVNEKKSINKIIMKAINFGIERETPKLQSDEKLQVNINDNNNDINILVSRVKKEENKLK